VITTTNPDVLAAVQQFLRFQIAEHQTGDSSTVPSFNSAFLWGVGRPKRKRLVDILNVGWRPFSCLQAVLTFLELAFSGHSVSDLASTVGYESDEVSGSSPVPDGIVGGVIRHVSRIGSYP
jgi:hypothetical protein